MRWVCCGCLRTTMQHALSETVEKSLGRHTALAQRTFRLWHCRTVHLCTCSAARAHRVCWCSSCAAALFADARHADTSSCSFKRGRVQMRHRHVQRGHVLLASLYARHLATQDRTALQRAGQCSEQVGKQMQSSNSQIWQQSPLPGLQHVRFARAWCNMRTCRWCNASCPWWAWQANVIGKRSWRPKVSPQTLGTQKAASDQRCTVQPSCPRAPSSLTPYRSEPRPAACQRA